jgi:hypothetical protein
MIGKLRELLHSAYVGSVAPSRRKAIYRILHAAEYRALRTAVFPSPKGTFSLRRCDELRTIFVHTPKAAGTSVALSIFGELPYHYTAADYLTIFGRETFTRYFTFTFVRNPWDRVYSAYTYLKRGGWDEKDRAWTSQHLSPYRDFADFVHNGLRQPAVQQFMHFVPQHEFICDQRERILVDYVGYFETITEDFAEICRRIGIEATLAHTNRSTERTYHTVYDNNMRQIVGQVYARDIRIFRYDFDKVAARVAPAVSLAGQPPL